MSNLHLLTAIHGVTILFKSLHFNDYCWLLTSSNIFVTKKFMLFIAPLHINLSLKTLLIFFFAFVSTVSSLTSKTQLEVVLKSVTYHEQPMDFVEDYFELNKLCLIDTLL